MEISCIIPAYNEAARIGAVLDCVAGHKALAEVIVIDDGSRDGTADIAEREGVRVIRLNPNRGKAWAVAEGVAAATGSHLMFIDADLAGLTPADIDDLVRPIAEGSADATISLRGNSPLVWRAIGLDYISGERVFPRSLLAARIDELRHLPKFGLEVFLNRLWIEARMRIAVVEWPAVASPLKATKLGLWQGMRADGAMMRDIFRTIPPSDALSQIRALREARIMRNSGYLPFWFRNPGTGRRRGRRDRQNG